MQILKEIPIFVMTTDTDESSWVSVAGNSDVYIYLWLSSNHIKLGGGSPFLSYLWEKLRTLLRFFSPLLKLAFHPFHT